MPRHQRQNQGKVLRQNHYLPSPPHRQYRSPAGQSLFLLHRVLRTLQKQYILLIFGTGRSRGISAWCSMQSTQASEVGG